MTTLADRETTVPRWDANIRALRILKELEREGREATPEEREALKRFSGFGDTNFNNAFQTTTEQDYDKRPRGLRYGGNDPWARRGDELRELLTPEEYESIRESRLTAFYTSPHIVDSMWQGLQGMGIGELDSLKVLEPSAGSGRFIERQPAALRRKSAWTAVEIDDLTAGLLKHSFEDVDVKHSPLEETVLADNTFDLAISNVPFGAEGVHDPEYLRAGKGHLTNSVHNYFFAKGLDLVRPGGIVAFVTTHYTMDSPKSERVRAALAAEADLVGAVRLPTGAFPDTKVVTDIIYLRKRLPGEAPGGHEWVKTEKIELDGTEQPINRYFLKNPGQVLGTETTARHGMRGAYEYTVLPSPTTPVADVIGAATADALRDAPDITRAAPRTPGAAPQLPQVARKSKPRLSASDKARVDALAAVRDLARRQVDLESGGASESEIEDNRLQLQDAYLAHVDKYGALNTPTNYALMGDDDDRALLFSLETYDKESECWQPADIMGVRTISAGGAMPELGGASDALDYHLQTKGGLDFAEVGALVGLDEDAARDSLLAAGRVYKLPKGGWATSEEYLSGNVREKLEWAERAAAADPSFQPNVEALREVLPPWVPGEDISVPLGSPWVPDELVNQWIAESLGIPPHGTSRHSLYRGGPTDTEFFAYEPDFGRWRQRRQFPAHYRTQAANSEWGTPKVPAQKIIEKMLTGGSLAIGEMSKEDIRFAQERARALQEDWEEWLWRDPERAASLERRYNHTFNEYRPRTYKGKEFYPGMATGWQRDLHPFQREAIQRVVSEGTTLLAHEVGFGKTASMVASAMERQRLGLTEKPMFVIPKATHAQFQEQFMELYPGARILAPEEGEFSAANRERFLSRIATNDWDAVILTGEQFEAIPLSPNRERAYVESEKAHLQAALETLDADETEHRDKGMSMSQKAVDSAVKSLDKKLRDRLAKIDRDETIYFDQLGVDMLYVDEADRYKNLGFRTGMGGRGAPIKGMPSTEAARSRDMHTKIQYLQGLPDPGEVVFATGTPISNTLAEAWIMQKYLNEPELRRQGLHHFDAWAKTFGDIADDTELDAAGRYKRTTRFRDFVNKPELARMFQEVADIRVASETPTIQALRPRLAGGERHIVTSPRDPQLDAYMKVINFRAENIPMPPQPGDDNMLKILTDGRKASMDLRLVEDDEGYAGVFGAPVGKEARPYPEGKLVQVARNVARIHEAEAPVKGIQLVFLDMGTPKAVKSEDGKADKTTAAAEAELAAGEAAIETGLYRVLKERMVDQGVPEDQIAFIHDYPTDDQREDLFDEVRKGNIRVVIGSTEKMGVGVNVQDRAAALHHVDAPWRPRDIEQREGRIVRQGNKVYGPLFDADKNIIDEGRGVQVYQYVQKGGLDEFMWQSLEVKGRGIKGIMKREIDAGERRIQDVDALVLTAADTKAAAAANPLVKRNVELGHAIKNAQSERKAHQLRTKTAQQEIAGLEWTINRTRAWLPSMERDAAYVQGMAKEDKFPGATIGRQTYDKSTDAGEALRRAVVGLPMDRTGTPPRPLGEYKGFAISGNRFESGYTVGLTRPGTEFPYEIHFGSKEDIVPEGIMRRLSNQISGIPERLGQARERLSTSEQRLGSAQREASERWGGAAQLQALQAEQEAVEARLKAGETGEEEEVAYGLQPLPVAPWTPAQVAAVERQVAGDRPTPTVPTAPGAPAPPPVSAETPPVAVVAEPPAPPRKPAPPTPPPAPPEEPKPVSAEPEPAQPAEADEPPKATPPLTQKERQMRAAIGRGAAAKAVTSNQYTTLEEYARSKGVDLFRWLPEQGFTPHSWALPKADAVRAFDLLAQISEAEAKTRARQLRQEKLQAKEKNLTASIERVQRWTPETFKGGSISGPEGPAWATVEGVERRKAEDLAVLERDREEVRQQLRALGAAVPEPPPVMATPEPAITVVEPTPEPPSPQDVRLAKVLEAVANDQTYRNAMANSDAQNARIEHDKAFDREMMALAMEDAHANADLYNAYGEMASFRDAIRGHSFEQSYQPPTAPASATAPWEYIDKPMHTKEHVFQANDRMKYSLYERGKRWENTLWVQRDDGSWAAGYYPPAGYYDTLQEAKDAAEQHFREWEASGEAPPPVQGWRGGGPFGGGYRMTLEEIRQSEEDAKVRKAENEKKAARQAKAKATRDAKRPFKLADQWRTPRPEMALKDLRRNLRVLRGIDESQFPPGEYSGIVAAWEQALAAAEPAPEPPAPAAAAPEPPSEPVAPSRPRDARRQRREALRKEIEDLGGVAPEGASIKELTPILDKLLQPAPEPVAVEAVKEAVAEAPVKVSTRTRKTAKKAAKEAAKEVIEDAPTPAPTGTRKAAKEAAKEAAEEVIEEAPAPKKPKPTKAPPKPKETHFLPPTILAKVRRRKTAKPALPKVKVGSGKKTSGAPPGFAPPKLPGRKRG